MEMEFVSSTAHDVDDIRLGKHGKPIQAGTLLIKTANKFVQLVQGVWGCHIPHIFAETQHESLKIVGDTISPEPQISCRLVFMKNTCTFISFHFN